MLGHLRETYLERGELELGPRHEAWLASSVSYSVPAPARVEYVRKWLKEYPGHPLLLGALGRAQGLGTPAGVQALEQSVAAHEREGWFDDPMARWEARKALRDLVVGLATADERERVLPLWRRLVELDPQAKSKAWAKRFEWLPRD